MTTNTFDQTKDLDDLPEQPAVAGTSNTATPTTGEKYQDFHEPGILYRAVENTNGTVTLTSLADNNTKTVTDAEWRANFENVRTPAIESAAANDEDVPVPTHEPTPADALDAPPTDDGLNHVGYFRRPAGEDQPEGSTIVIKGHATPSHLASVVRDGFMQFLGWVPSPTAAVSGTVGVKPDAGTTPADWAGKTFDVPPAE